MKKLLPIFLSILLMICVAGCSGNAEIQTEADTPNPIVDKIYLNNTPLLQKSLDFDFLKFYDDNTFQGIDIDYRSYYGTYTINGNGLTLNLSDKTYAGVILDEGAEVIFGDDKFSDGTERIKETDTLLEKFK